MAANPKTCKTTPAGNTRTPKARMSFVHLLEPNKNSTPTKDGKYKYQVSLLIPADADLSLLKEKANEAAKDRWGDKLPARLKTPFLNAADYEYNGYEEGMTLIRCSSVVKPGLVNAKGENVDDAAEVYSGRWCFATLRPFSYDVDGNRGVSFGIQNVQLLDHDDVLGGGKPKAEDEFESVDDEASETETKGADGVFG